jgi:hypothetical protein
LDGFARPSTSGCHDARLSGARRSRREIVALTPGPATWPSRADTRSRARRGAHSSVCSRAGYAPGQARQRSRDPLPRITTRMQDEPRSGWTTRLSRGSAPSRRTALPIAPSASRVAVLAVAEQAIWCLCRAWLPTRGVPRPLLVPACACPACVETPTACQSSSAASAGVGLQRLLRFVVRREVARCE